MEKKTIENKLVEFADDYAETKRMLEIDAKEYYPDYVEEGNNYLELKEELQITINELTEYVSQELSKAREEGRRYQRELDEMINGITIEDSTLERGKEYVIISKETYEELSKLKDNK